MPVEKLTPDRRRQLTRDTLLDAAEAVFAKKGMGGASMEEIASEAGFTRGAIYSNFGSKEELLLAVIDRRLAKQLEAYAEVTPAEDAVANALDAAAVFRRTRSTDLIPLELELRVNALRHPAARERLVESDRRESDNTARLIENLMGADAKLKFPARDLGDIGRAAVIGLLQYAAVDEEEAPRYLDLVESLFMLLAIAIEPEAPAPTSAKRRTK